jgi:hypothetical protein
VKRFVAITTSVVMICIAIVIRSNVIDDSGSPSTPSGPLTIACVTELEAQCRALSNVTVRVEDASVTARALAAGTAGIDGWVTFDPWPEITDLLAQRDAVGDSIRIVRSPLTIATVQEREVAFGCRSWRCIGDASGQPWTDHGGRPEWGTVKVGLPPSTSGTGLLLFGNAVSGFFGRADIATNDFTVDPDFPVWRAKLSSAFTPAPFTRFLQQFPAAFSFVGVTDAERSTAVRAGVGALVPDPAAFAVVVLAPVNGGRVSGLTGDLRKKLAAVGWSIDAVDQPSGLPNAGVLLALSGLAG